jgi:nucleotide-binding universal stress UspA family protein
LSDDPPTRGIFRHFCSRLLGDAFRMYLCALATSKRSILVPLDLSDVTENVLLEARRLARAWHAEIHLLHVGRDGRKTGGMEFELVEHLNRIRAEHETEKSRLDEYARMLGHEGFRIRARFAVGNPCKAILEEARELDPAAIVIGMHGHGVLHDALKSSIRRSLLGEGAWPVVVVSPDGTKRAAHRLR